ncbi:hypothetical protein [Roseateles sp. BYS96W]|uniref:Uncharacterized protein n=1 Tax=Pelomonas nitida TaxID=3299027 RepID=A0ABW7G3E5_9BURK
MERFIKNPLAPARSVETPVRETLARPLLTPGQDVPMSELPTRPRDVERDLEAQWETAAGQVGQGWQPSLQPISEQSLSPQSQQQARAEGSSSGAIQHQTPDVPMVDLSSTHRDHGPDLEAQRGAADTGEIAATPDGGRWRPRLPTVAQAQALGTMVVDAVSSVANAATRGIKKATVPLLRPPVDLALKAVTRKNARLLKQTTSHSSLWYSKTKSTISEPLSIADKSASIYTSMTDAALAKLKPAETLATTDRADVKALARVNSDALAVRLARNTNLLQNLRADSTATKQVLHDCVNSKLEATAFAHTANYVRTVAAMPPSNTDYADRQVDTVARTPEAHIEQGIKTLNLLSEGMALQASIRQPSVSDHKPAERDDLQESAERLEGQCRDTRKELEDFERQYTDFVRNQLGSGSPGNYADDIKKIASPATSPAERATLHAQVMTKVVAERRIDQALEAVHDPIDRANISRRIDSLSIDDAAVGRQDHRVIELVTELTNERPGFIKDQSAREFLQRLAEMNGPPLDEVLRAYKGIYRTAWAPAAQAPADAPGKVRHEQARDMEKVHAELTSIAMHVRAAAKTGALQRQLDALFQGDPGDPGAAVARNFEASFQRLIKRPPGDDVAQQDKLNVKLAKCILDHGADVRGLAANLQRTQERYVTELGNSPDMLKMLRNGSTGASYDPVEQRANARMRLDALRASVLEVNPDYKAETSYGRDEVNNAVSAAKALLRPYEVAEQTANAQRADRPDAVKRLEQRMFLMENYVRDANATEPEILLRQLADNDPRCGTDAVIAENMNLSGNFGASIGGKVGGAVSLNGSLDGSLARQFPTDYHMLAPVRNEVPNSLVLLESSAYAMKAIVDLETKVDKGTLKGNFSFGASMLGPTAFAAAGNAGIGFERVTIQNKGPGLVCMVHKAPVLDGTASNAKLAGATHLAINDNVNQALFSKPEVDNLQTVNTTIDGWDNLNRFFAATDRATLEPLIERKEVTTTLSFGEGISPAGVTASESFFPDGMNHGQFSGRIAVALDGKMSHSFREETISTATLHKFTASDTFSDTRSASAGLSMRLGGGVLTDGGVAAHLSEEASKEASRLAQQLGDDHAEAIAARDAAKLAADRAKEVPRFRYGMNVDVTKLSRGIEHSREYKELYKRVVRDQFGNEIPSLVRDSKTSTDGRLLVNNLVNEIGLISATVSQRIADGGRDMPPIEKETVTKLLCLSTLASHYSKAGVITVRKERTDDDLRESPQPTDGDLTEPQTPPNDNLTINVTAALTPAAAARLAAAKINRRDGPLVRETILNNSLNYSTIGAAGGFKNQDTSSKVKGVTGRSKRSTSSAQSAGYPSGTDMLDHATAKALDTMLRRAENRDILTALESAGMGRPLELLSQYEALTRPETPGPTTA